MPRIRIADVIFPIPGRSQVAIEGRLITHYRGLIAKRLALVPPLQADGSRDESLWRRTLAEIAIPKRVDRRIGERASRIAERHVPTPAFLALRSEDRTRIERLCDGAELVAIPSEHRADELAAELHAGFPWLAPATEVVWRAMRASVRRGDAGFRLPPLLLDGPPGIGKSTWARRLAGLIGVPGLALDATGENAGFGIAGCQKGWGTASMGRPLELILETLVANPVIVIDEVDKAGIARSNRNVAFDLTAALLPFLEPGTAAKWNCPYSRLVYDMSWIGWVLTANAGRDLPAPLLSRCRVIELADIGTGHLRAFAQAEATRRGLGPASVEVIAEALDRLARHRQPVSLRQVIRMLERAEAMEARPLVN